MKQTSIFLTLVSHIIALDMSTSTMINWIDIIWMNSAVYHPVTGHFVSQDLLIPNHIDLQNYEYSSSFTTKTTYKDHRGFIFKRVFRSIRSVIKGKVKKIVTSVKTIVRGPNDATAVVLSMVVAAILPACVPLILNGASGGFSGGLVASKGDKHAGLKGAITGAVFACLSGHFGSTWNVKRVAIKATTAGPQQVYVHCYVSLNKLKRVACSI